MPRFFFNVRGGRDFPDAEGVEFADASAACGEAVTLAGEMLRDVTARCRKAAIGNWTSPMLQVTGLALSGFP